MEEQIIIIIHKPVLLYSGMRTMAEQLKDVDKNTAFLLELALGLFGFLGIGYLYAGDASHGVLRLVLWWVILGVAWTIIGLLTAILIGLCLIPFMLAAQIAVPIWSAFGLKKRLDEKYPGK
jgi:TM2 domain-containing membrane protein YozV